MVSDVIPFQQSKNGGVSDSDIEKGFCEMNVPDDTQIFAQTFRVWIRRTCREWNVELPPESYYSEVYARLPVGLRTTLEFGYKQGLLLDAGKSKTGSAGF